MSAPASATATASLTRGVMYTSSKPGTTTFHSPISGKSGTAARMAATSGGVLARMPTAPARSRRHGETRHDLGPEQRLIGKRLARHDQAAAQGGEPGRQVGEKVRRALFQPSDLSRRDHDVDEFARHDDDLAHGLVRRFRLNLFGGRAIWRQVSSFAPAGMVTRSRSLPLTCTIRVASSSAATAASATGHGSAIKELVCMPQPLPQFVGDVRGERGEQFGEGFGRLARGRRTNPVLATNSRRHSKRSSGRKRPC
jgi:hypothetical protein